MKKLAALTLTLAALAAPLLVAAPAHAGADKVGICHATGNGKYVEIEISEDGTANGHAGHQDGADIIPAYSWVENGVRNYFDGQNLDKASLLGNGCKVPPTTVTPAPPVYAPGTCLDKTSPYGRVTLPEGIEGTTALNASSTVWTVTYTAPENTVWAEGTGTYSINVVPVGPSDKNWVVDSRTGKGGCELPDTGAGSTLMLAAVAGFVALGIGAVVLVLRRRLG